MSKKTRILALLLAALMVLPACKTDSDNDKESTKDTSKQTESSGGESTPDETEAKPRTPDVKYTGKDFSVLYRDESAKTYICEDVFVEDGSTGDVVDQVVFNRNEKLAQQFDVNLVFTGSDSPTSDMKTDVTAGTKEFDVVTDGLNQLIATGAQSVFYNIKDLKYVSPESPWWDANSFEMSIANRLYAIVGDISMNASSRARYVYFNKQIHENYNLKNPYELVDADAWTLDEFKTMAAAVYEDTDSSLTPNAADKFGLLSESYSFFAVGAGVIYSGKDENDIPTITCVNERTVDVLTKIKELFTDKEHVISYQAVSAGEDTSAFGHIFDWGRSLFAQGHFLFVQNGANVANQFADMEDSYGILPNPKFDTAQESYYHLMDPFACGWAISSNCDDYEMIDVLMDNWAYLSADLVEAFYETTMKGKRLDMPEDARMLDLIRNSIVYELTYIYDVGFSGVLDKAFNSSGQINIASTYKSMEKLIARRLSTLAEDYGYDPEAATEETTAEADAAE